jgi:glycosyltransferase involved in cell wall biosynthesis
MRPKIMISFDENGGNGGPYNSHKRIMDSDLKNYYDFYPLVLPYGKRLYSRIHCLISAIRENNPDIVHIHGLQTTGFYLAVAAKYCKKPVVMAIHGSVNEAISINIFIRIVISIMERIAIILSDSIYGVSNYVSNWRVIHKYGKKKLYGTIYNLPHKSIDTKTRDEVRKQFGFKAHDIVVVSTGRITKEKGFDTLCDCIINIKQIGNIKFLIAGDGEYLNTFKMRIKKVGLEKNVVFLGYVNNIDDVYKASDIFVICTKHETLCNSLLEAGQMNLPLIASNVGGIPEIIIDNVNGFLVDSNESHLFAEKIIKLVSNKELRLSMGRKSKQIITMKFSEDKVTSQINEIYKGLIKHES